MDKKIILLALLFSSIVFAQQSIPAALGILCEDIQLFFSAIAIYSIILAVPFIAIGLFLYFKKKDNKTLRIAGIAMAVIGVAAPILLIVIYLLIPVILSALIGGGPPVNC